MWLVIGGILITIDINTTVSNGKRDEFIHSVDAVHDLLKNTPGFVRSAVYQDMNNSKIFNIRQEWMTIEDVQAYMGTYGFEAFLGALKILTDDTEISCRLCKDLAASITNEKSRGIDMKLMASYGA